MTDRNQIRVVKENQIFGILAAYENGQIDSEQSWVTIHAQDLVTITNRLFASKKHSHSFLWFQIEPAAVRGRQNVFARVSTFDLSGHSNNDHNNHLKIQMSLETDEIFLDHMIKSGWEKIKELIKQLSEEKGFLDNPFLFLWRLTDSTARIIVRQEGGAKLSATRRRKCFLQSSVKGLVVMMQGELHSCCGCLFWPEGKTTLYHVGLEIEEETDRLMELLPFVPCTEIKHKTDEASLLYTEPLLVFYKPTEVALSFCSGCGGFYATIHPDKIIGKFENVCGDSPLTTKWIEMRKDTPSLMGGVRSAIERARHYYPQMFYSFYTSPD